MFADDVKNSAINVKGLQRILKHSIHLGSGKRHEVEYQKSVVIRTPLMHEFKWAGSALKKVREVKYLGVPLTEDGVSEAKTVEKK